MQELDSHSDAIIGKFSNIIVDQVLPAINGAKTSVKWDAAIEKNQTVSAQAYIEQILQTMQSMTKILI